MSLERWCSVQDSRPVHVCLHSACPRSTSPVSHFISSGENLCEEQEVGLCNIKTVDLLLLMSLKSSYSHIELCCCLVSIFLPSLAFHRRVDSPSLCRHLITCIGNSEQLLLCDHTTQYTVRMKTNTLSWTQRNSKKNIYIFILVENDMSLPVSVLSGEN